jgi:hypothetical protein
MKRSPDTFAQVGTIAVFTTVLVTVLVAHALLPDDMSSLLERRSLALRPKLSRAGVLDGSYFKGWEEYLGDHLPWREQWLRLYGVFRLNILSPQLIRGVYLGSDGYLLNSPEAPAGPGTEASIAAAVDRLDALNGFIESQGGRFVYLHVPNKQAICRRRYPSYVQWPESYDRTDVSLIGQLRERAVSAIDLRSIFLERADDDLFYRTDHHWTFEGSYVGYCELVRHFGLAPYSLGDLKVTTLPNPYVGSQNRRLGMAVATQDRLTVAEPKVPVPYTMTVTGGKPVPLFRMPKDPSEPVDYLAFMGGDLGEIVIDTHRPELPDALLVGTSFTNCIEPLLYLHYNQLRILDLRAFKSMSLYDYIALHRPDQVMLLVSGHEILDDKDNSHFGEPTTTPVPK